jgi:hypothetical protein
MINLANDAEEYSHGVSSSTTAKSNMINLANDAEVVCARRGIMPSPISNPPRSKTAEICLKPSARLPMNVIISKVRSTS